MLSLLLALTSTVIVFSITGAGGWSYFWAILAFILVQVSVALILRKRLTGVNLEIQEVIVEGQKRLQHKMNQMQQRPQGNPQMMQKILEKDRDAFLAEAIEKTALLEPFFKWNMMLKKQVTTMKMQLNYQMQNWKDVDELMPKALMMDPNAVAMKMARQYKNKDMDGLEKTFKKYSKSLRFKGAQAILIYAVYSWCLIKKGDPDAALKVLVEGKAKTGSEVLKKNWEALANNKPKMFSNAGLGDQWYMLGLEQPKMPKQQRQRMSQAKSGRPF